MKNNFFKVYPKRAIWTIIYTIMATVILALFIVTYNNFQDAVAIEKSTTTHIGRTIDGLQLFYNIVLAVAIIAYINHLIMSTWIILNITYGIDSGKKQVKWIALSTFVEFFLTFFVLGFVGDVMVYEPSWFLFAILLIVLLVAPIFTNEVGTFEKGNFSTIFELSQAKFIEIKSKK